MKTINILIIMVLLVSNSCKTTYPQHSFTIGKGGGFTGKYDVFLVKENGEILMYNKEYPKDFIKKMNKKVTAEIFNEFNNLNISEKNISHPGNMTSFIRYESDGKTHEIKWGGPGYEPPQDVISFFNKVWDIIKLK